MPGGERGRALDSAVRALARRDHSTASLGAKLERAGVSEAARNDALAELAEAGYLDDARFAGERARILAGRGYGNDLIRADLETNGVPTEAVEAAVALLEPERERALRQAGALGGGLRAATKLQRRGFSEETLEELCAGPLRTTQPQQ